MAGYILFLLWILAILFLGVIESAVYLPMISLAAAVFFVKGLHRWLRITALVLLGIVWGVLISISPAAMVFLLLGGSWLDASLSGKIHQRQSIFLITILITIITCLLRGMTLSPGLLIGFLLQAGILWLCTRFFVTNRKRSLVFFLPPRTLNHDKKAST